MSLNEEFKMEQNYLYHYGVLGMKWGVRRSRKKAAKAERKSAKQRKEESYSEDYKRVKALKKKKLYEMSNAEIRELNNRMQLETQYKDLKKKNVSKGQKFVTEVLTDVGKQVLKETIKESMKGSVKGATKAYKKTMSMDDLKIDKVH